MAKKVCVILASLLSVAVGGQDRITVRLKTNLTVSPFVSPVYPCTTPDGEKSSCISLFSCPGLMKALGSLERPLVQHVHKSICPIGGSGELYVCCGESDKIVPNQVAPKPLVPKLPAPKPSVTKPPPVISTSEQTSESSTLPARPHPDPPRINVPHPNTPKERELAKKYFKDSRVFCGMQHNDGRFSKNGNQTELDEFPWLVRIKISDFEYEEEYGDRCSGVLISDQYVLTDAYCAYHAIKVVIGEYKTNTSFICGNDTNFPDCTEPAYEVRVAEILRDGKSENGPYDLALLHLQRPVQFSDYVRPICLPFKESERARENDTLTFSGWGSRGPAAVVKKRILYDQASDKMCYEVEGASIEGNVKFANVTHLCVKSKKDTAIQACYGDHGGPLMFAKKARWVAEAIVIQVLPEDYKCHSDGFVSSIKITSKTLDWIINTIVPSER